MKRLLTAVVFLPLFVGVVGWTPAWCFALLVVVAAGFGVVELARLAAPVGLRVHQGIAVCLGAGAGFLFLNPQRAATWVLMVLAAAVALALVRGLAPEGRPDGALAAASGTVFAVLYPGVLLAHLVGVRSAAMGRELIFFLFAVIWVSDTAAYYIGSALGQRKLAPRLSPGKTVEGAAAGVLGAAAAAVACRYLFLPELGPMAPFLGAGLGLVGIVGDLAESVLKRGAGVKDTAGLLPGHGGILDRVDSLLLAGPLFYYLHPWFLS
jgi:phosphatidate cytidylyltransferase